MDLCIDVVQFGRTAKPPGGLDIVTFDTPRATGCRDSEWHGRTLFGYQTNGQRFDGLQSVEYGARDWGFRASYNILEGNDYRDGDHNKVPSSYNSQNYNFAVGVDITPNSTIELKALRLYQHDVEVPGLYFDIRRLDTEAYNVRYTLRNQPYFDQLTLDSWYNYTVGNGDTLQGYKQTFLSQFLPGPNGFNLPGAQSPSTRYPTFFSAGNTPPGFVPFLTDHSTTRFGEHTAGYRLASMWGKKDSLNFTLGSDFTYLQQGLRETILIDDPSGQIATTGSTTDSAARGAPRSPDWNATPAAASRTICSCRTPTSTSGCDPSARPSTRPCGCACRARSRPWRASTAAPTRSSAA
jgi:hypothetical protein